MTQEEYDTIVPSPNLRLAVKNSQIVEFLMFQPQLMAGSRFY